MQAKVASESVNGALKVASKSVKCVPKVTSKNASNMLKRKIYSRLVKWREQQGHKPLVVYGCRQCGKTYSVLDFAEKNYAQVVYLNFYEHSELKSIFSGSLSVDAIMLNISSALHTTEEYQPGRTCLIFDEIQECPEARTSLKFFKLDGRYDVICTGSLLGVSGYGEQPASIPVGYETHLQMFPLDFEEFLWANNQSDAVIDQIRQCLEQKSPVPEAIHQTMRKLLYTYTVVGGMPEAVNTFIEKNNLSLVWQCQQDILLSYRQDMLKYAKGEMKANIIDCFESIPRQLSKENKKFQYSVIRKGGRAERYESSLRWIEDAGIIKRSYNLEITELPYNGHLLPDTFKVYMVDSGLFIAMLDRDTQYDVLQGKVHTYKGAIFENLIADILTKMGRPLFYYHKEGGIELDFLLRYKGQSTPLEVKATNGNTKSLKTVLAHPEKYDVYHAIKLADTNIGEENGILTLPQYMAFLLTDY